jgi:hypothetical protein
VYNTDWVGSVVVPNPKGPYTCGIWQTSLLLNVPFNGHVWAEVFPAARKDRAARPTIIQFFI